MARRHLSKAEAAAYLAKKRLAYALVAVAIVVDADLLLLTLGKSRPRAVVAALLISLFVPAVFWGFYRLGRWMLYRVPPADLPCRHCGYELKGLPSDRCPECGQRCERAN